MAPDGSHFRPGVYPDPFYLVNGVEVLGASGEGAEMSVIQAPIGFAGPLVTGEGVAAASLGNLSLVGNNGTIGLRIEDGARQVRLTRSIVRGNATGVKTGGQATDLEVVNNTIVNNQAGMVAADCSALSVRNNIFAYNSTAGLTYDACARRRSHTYNDYWANGPDGNDRDIKLVNGTTGGRGPAGLGEIFTDPLLAGPPTDNYRLTLWSPAIGAGDPSEPVPPGTGEHIDIGYREFGRASAYADKPTAPTSSMMGCFGVSTRSTRSRTRWMLPRTRSGS